MKSEPKNTFNRKDYLFLTVCLFIFFTVIMYVWGQGELRGSALIGVIIAVPIVLYVLKKLYEEQG